MEDWVPGGVTVNRHYYKKVLESLGERVKRNRPHLWKNEFLLHRENMPAPTALLSSFWPNSAPRTPPKKLSFYSTRFNSLPDVKKKTTEQKKTAMISERAECSNVQKRRVIEMEILNCSINSIISCILYIAKRILTPDHDTYILFQFFFFVSFTVIITIFWELLWEGFQLDFGACLWRFVIIQLQKLSWVQVRMLGVKFRRQCSSSLQRCSLRLRSGFYT